ncbi:MAG: hypothetical protein H7A38_07235 [Chlamydiales bacterium]|nr:hypothetical protein [Chlamydiales bacterium]
MANMMINGLKNVGAGFALTGAALYGAKALLSAGELGFKAVDKIADSTEKTKTGAGFVGKHVKDWGFSARFGSTTPAKETATNFAKFAVAALVLSEIAFRLSSSPVSIMNVAFKVLPFKMNNESVPTTLMNTNWSNPFQSA